MTLFEAFSSWLLTCKSKDGKKTYTQATRNNYLNSIKRISVKLVEKGYINIPFYENDNLPLAEATFNLFMNDPELRAFSKSQGNDAIRYSQEAYIRFLRERNLQAITEPNPIPDQKLVSYWLIPANPKIYNHELAFIENGYIVWRQNADYKTNDLGFIYMALPFGQIKYLVRMTEVDIPVEKAVDESKYWLTNKYRENVTRYAKMELLKTLDDERLKYKYLELNGLKRAPQKNMRLSANYDSLLKYILGIIEGSDPQTTPLTVGRNILFYGNPGCGKSYFVKNNVLINTPEDDYFRTTFHQEYTHSDFIGQIMPDVKNGNVTYRFQEGPFARTIKRALENPNRHIYLIIEEINRGNAPAIFGDTFQLLDRVKIPQVGQNEVQGQSEFPINNYLLESFIGRTGKVYIPSNMSIVATMNTSDQNVFTLDNAFKRRFEFIKIPNRFSENDFIHPYEGRLIPGTNVTWKSFVEAINKKIVDETDSIFSTEDKQIGVFFCSENELSSVTGDNTTETRKRFAYKMLEYLWDDVSKTNRASWFGDQFKTLDQLIDGFVKDGLDVFFNTKFQNE